MTRVAIRPEILRWALDRAGLEPRDITERFPQFDLWLSGNAQPTLKQLERFAKATYTPIGFLFLATPLDEPVPIPDFRTMPGARGSRISPNLRDTIYICQERQDWYRDFARAVGEPALAFVGSASIGDDVVTAANTIRGQLGFDVTERAAMRTWTDALRRFIEQIDGAGVLVMCSGVVRNNNRRRLAPAEFRGFALADDVAPLVFINGADTKAAQMFTLAHELAHIWLGQSAITDAQAARVPDEQVERWCNRVAAELLVPLREFQLSYRPNQELRGETLRLARQFKVSSLVILRRIHDVGGLDRERFWREYEAELERLLALPKTSGGDFYLTLGARASKRFARAIVATTLEGRHSFTETFRLLGVKKMRTFNELANSLGIGA